VADEGQRTKGERLIEKKAKKGRGAQRGDYVRVMEGKGERVIARMSGE
jgi:hypothetical protein